MLYINFKGPKKELRLHAGIKNSRPLTIGIKRGQGRKESVTGVIYMIKVHYMQSQKYHNKGPHILART
jgi:hypothetical protein